MHEEEELAVEDVTKLFRKFAFPAVAGFIIGSIQIIIDGYFIGNVVGTSGLAAITLVFPLLMAMMAAIMMLGTGAATLVALELGKANRKQAIRVASNLVSMMLIAGAFFALVGLLFTDSLVDLLGATDLVSEMGSQYLRIMFIGSVFFIGTMGFDPIVRNDGRPLFAMKMTAIAAVTNIILDYLFVMKWGMGMQGAAIASVLSFAVSATVFTIYFFSRHSGLQLRLSTIETEPRIFTAITRAGVPAFILQASLAVLVLCYNYMLLSYGSEVALSSYGVIEYSFSIFYMIFEGISTGVQPIIGFNYGAKLYDRVYSSVKIAMLSCFTVGFVGFALLYLFSDTVIGLFNQNDPQLLSTAVEGMRIFMFGIIVEGIIITAGVYYQSVHKINKAMFIQFGKIFIFILPLLFILPHYYGLKGVWMATPIGQYLMFSAIVIMLLKEKRFLKEGIEET